VHLRDDDALGAVDDEGAVHGHQRDVAGIDVLLLDVLHRLGAGVRIDVEGDQAQRHLERRGKGHAALAALVDVVLRRLELVAHELQDGDAGEVRDGEHRLEHGLKAVVLASALRLDDLQELVVGRLLNLDEVRHLRHFLDLAEELADPLATGERLRHVDPCSDPRPWRGLSGEPRCSPAAPCALKAPDHHLPATMPGPCAAVSAHDPISTMTAHPGAAALKRRGHRENRP